MIDKSLEPTYDIQSIWKITEIALLCVKSNCMERPSISEVLKEIQEAIMMEQKALTGRVESIDIFARNIYPIGCHSKFNMCYSDGSENSSSYAESFSKPRLR
jgi:hypothetical protein